MVDPDDFDTEVQCEEAYGPEDFAETDVDFPDADDGDWMDADALASAGWGVDEDYGGYPGDDW